MNLLFDTNILLHLARDRSGVQLIRFINPNEAVVYASFATVAEIESLAFQQGWGFAKQQRLAYILEQLRIIEINDMLLNTYLDLDAYSQRKHPDFQAYPFDTPRNMGKHDLWIGATASFLNLTLVTTDGDFDHLDGSFLTLKKLLPADIAPLLQ
jgi:tRNA(fMet)-specific endonuclease VapC